MNTYAISGLVKKRAEIAGDIENAQDALKKLVTDLEHLDAAILLFDPDYKIDDIKPKAFRPPEDWAKRGEMSRVILDMLRNAREPMTARDIALSLMTLRGMDQADRRAVRKMTKRTGAALRHARDRGLLESKEGPGMTVVWTLVKLPSAAK
jgi:hypothetical protein